jgi:hypothetical protein
MKTKNCQIIIVGGYSGAGKDLFSSYLVEALTEKQERVQIVKFSRPLKDLVEQSYNLQTNSLDYESAKDEYVTHPVSGKFMDYTYRDILIRAFKVWDEIVPDGSFTLGLVKRSIKPHTNLIFNDVRKQCEVELIKSLANIHSYELIYVPIKGNRGVKLESDGGVNYNECIFKRIHAVTNHKSTSTQTLQSIAEKIING